MKHISVLDTTLRDGGCVNDFNFGKSYMDAILHAEEEANIDIIELGYIDEKTGSLSNRTKYQNEKCIKKSLLHSKKAGISYVVMIDYGKFDFDQLENRCESGIDGIRLAFHKKDINKAIEAGCKIINKGYELYIQPMATLRYSDIELLQLIERVNSRLSSAKAFYIVDSFGEMRTNDVERLINLVDHNLLKDMAVGFHSHNNLQLSYSNAINILQYNSDRLLVIDASIMGMGKGAGNLNTELLLEHLNLYYQKNYNILPLLRVIDEVINQLYFEYKWGYSIEYYLSAVNRCSPSYARYYFDKHMVSVDKISELLSRIEAGKKISFDREYAENLYQEYRGSVHINDYNTIDNIKESINGKTVLIIAPGKSILEYKSVIINLSNKEDVCTIGLNLVNDFECDYIVITRENLIEDALYRHQKIITTSSIVTNARDNVAVLDYRRWIIRDKEIIESSFAILAQILIDSNVSNVVLAGFDGFSLDINSNYYDMNLRRPINSNQTKEKNEVNRLIVKMMEEKGICINYINIT